MTFPLPEYDESDATAMAGWVRDGEVKPLELVEAAIARVEARNPAVNAVVHTSFDRARQEAKSPRTGPFAGVPFLLKDLLAEDAGQPSTGSCQLGSAWRADADCELVARYKRAGLIVVGRTNTPELGIMGTTEPVFRGPTRNPWDVSRSSGGSSGGAGAAVAARMVPAAHGGDGGGSIRIPSANCGLFGLKPSRGRNPQGPFAGDQWAGLVEEHVLTRSVRDSAGLLDATCGADAGALYRIEPPTGRYCEEVGRSPGKLRIAVHRGALFASDIDADCVAAVEDAAGLARELGHDVGDDVPVFDRAALVRAYLTIVAVGTASGLAAAERHAGRSARASDVEPATWLLNLIARTVSAVQYAQALDAVRSASRRMAEFFARYDILLTATTARPAVLLGELGLHKGELAQLALLRAIPARALLMKALDAMAVGPISATPNTQLFNMTGQPAMSVPLFWNAGGLPIGTQWVGPFGREDLLFRLGGQLEAARPWHKRRPSTVQ